MHLNTSDVSEELFTHAQWIAIVWTPRISGSLSIIGLILIICIIWKGGKEKRSRVHNRLLIGMSVFYIINSAALVISTAAFPRSVSTIIYGAIGNQFTCSMQGFLLSLGVAGPLYGSMLCINYLLVIKYNISDDVVKSYEKYLHAVALIPTISFSLFGVFSDIFHPSLKMICWAAYGCELHYVADPNSDCEPKNQLKSDIVKFSMVGLGLCSVIIALYSMILIYISVRHQSMQMKKYQSWRAISQSTSFNRTPRCKDEQRDPSYETFTQALLYVLMYLFCSIFVVMAQFVKEIGFTLMILKAIFYPSTGEK